MNHKKEKKKNKLIVIQFFENFFPTNFKKIVGNYYMLLYQGTFQEYTQGKAILVAISKRDSMANNILFRTWDNYFKVTENVPYVMILTTSIAFILNPC